MKTSRLLQALTIVLLFILCLSLSACGRSAPPAEPDSSGPASEPAASEDPAVPDDPDEAVPSEEGSVPEDNIPPVRTLSCLADAATIEAVIPAGGGQVIVACYPSFEDQHRPVYRVDVNRDEILATEEDVSGWPLGCRKNGQLVTVDYESQTLFLYGEDFSLSSELSFAGAEACFSRDEDAVYLIDRGRLSRMDFDGNTEPLLSFTNGTYIDAADPCFGTALVLGRPVDEKASVAYMVYSFAGERLFCREADHGPFFFADGYLTVRDYGNGNGALLIYDPEDGWNPYVYACPIGMALTGFADTPLVCAVEETEGETENPSGIASVDISLVDIRSGDIMDICSYAEPRFVTFAWDGESGLFLVSASGSSGSDLLAVDPARLSVSRHLTPASPSPEPEAPALDPLPENLSDLRIRADTIEETFGIRILFGDEAARAAMGSDNDVESTSVEPETEHAQIASSLDRLEEAMAILPDGFTAQFLNYNGEAGLRVLFVHSLSDPVNDFDPAGVAYETGGWYNIAVETGPLTVSILQHELWHAVEDRMAADGVSLEEDWALLNPEGFMYIQNRGTYREEAAEEYLLGVPDHDSVYFLQDYSMLNDREDRATMIGFLFEAGTVRGQIDFLQYYPHLAAKLDCLAAAVASFFGSVYWLA